MFLVYKRCVGIEEWSKKAGRSREQEVLQQKQTSWIF